jgi:hypothetical protein
MASMVMHLAIGPKTCNGEGRFLKTFEKVRGLHQMIFTCDEWKVK